MTSKWMMSLVGLAACAAMGAASAAEPTQPAPSKPTTLTLAQMDNVTAGQGLINVSGNNVQLAAVVQAAVVALGSGNTINQGALSVNYFSY